MLKFKKITALILGTVMISGAIIGCGKSASSDKKDEVVNLTWYTIGQPQKDTEKVQEEINKYTKEKIGATVTIKSIDWGDYTKKMQVLTNSGEDYDIAFTCSWANDYLQNARKGAFLELDDAFKNELKDTYEAIDKRFWDGAKIDGKTYAVPTNKELGIAPSWVFTKEYVDKYNIPYKDIHTLQDLEPWLKIIKEKEPDVVPFYIIKDYAAPATFDPLIEKLIGVSLQNNDLKIENIFDTKEMKDNLDTMRKYYKAGYINKDAATAKDDRTIKRFVTKADGQPYADVMWSKDLRYPVVSSPIMDVYVTNLSTTGSMQAINKNSKHPEQAKKFLNLLNTDKKLRNLVNYGIEGTHYTKVADNKIKITPEQKNYSVPYFALGNLFITYTLDNEPDTKWDEFKKFNDESKPSPALGFKFNSDPVSTEIAGLKNVLDEFGPAIYSGSVEPSEYLPKLNDKLKATGIDKIKAEMQKQMDEWKKTKK
ncbi:carbohydrate ABC transporter substrate-binding protein, CUT1 family [Clostridium cavendishii DSM 21758]|uniref:Carbohydrate ABC transporter substrate-binding protein, CUT1 family n=1 Tax=Clostridium cavendishii DSM 21758 TaxID=1121302 RepID=A0A1M6MR80_9CLOT|nr:ABC transporter substrate-binding protein [Clostridium cavendishii]SHJ85932.1 carbohydrate ABC transporter substrate-binding protein, CUT1 family [Clostridium cavendishii DSM 21758]